MKGTWILGLLVLALGALLVWCLPSAESGPQLGEHGSLERRLEKSTVGEMVVHQPVRSRTAFEQPDEAAGRVEGQARGSQSAWSGRVVGPSGSLLTGAHLSLLGSENGRTVSDSSGRFYLAGLNSLSAAQQQRLFVVKAGLAPTLFALPAGNRGAEEGLDISVRMTRGGRLVILPKAQGATGEVEVRVQPAVGNPLRQALAMTGGRTWFGGTFNLGERLVVENLPTGRFSVSLSSPGLLGAHFSDVLITEQGVKDLGVVDLFAGREVTGRVLDWAGVPIAHATLRSVVQTTGQYVAPAAVTSAVDGSFLIPTAPLGAFHIEVSCAGYLDAVQPVEAGKNIAVDVHMEHGVDLVVQLVQPGGEAAISAFGQGSLLRADQRGGSVGRQISGGMLRFEGLGLGRHLLSLEVQGHPVSERVVQVKQGMRPVQIEIAQSVWLEGVVRSFDNRVGARATVFWLSDGGTKLSTRSGQDGSFRLAVANGSTGELFAQVGSLPGVHKHMGTLTASQNGLELILPELVQLSGKVSLPAGFSSDDLHVVVAHSPGQVRTTKVAANGTYQFDSLQLGTVHVRAYQGNLRSLLEGELPWMLGAGHQPAGGDLVLSSGVDAYLDVALSVAPQARLVRAIDLGFQAGIGRIAGTLTQRGAAGLGSGLRVRQVAVVPDHGRLDLVWEGLSMGTYDLVISTADTPKIVLHEEVLAIGQQLVQPRVLALECGRLRLSLLRGLLGEAAEVANLSIQISLLDHPGRGPITLSSRDASVTIPGLAPGRAEIRVIWGGKLIGTGEAQIRSGNQLTELAVDLQEPAIAGAEIE